MKKDVKYGMFFSVLVMYFITFTAGSVLNSNGVNNINTVQDAAKALQPLAGDLAYLLFAIGVIGISFLAIPVLAGSVSYIIAETFGWSEGLNKPFLEAREFYFVMIISTLLGLIGVILHICNNKRIMEKYTNSVLTNIVGIIALLLMAIAAIVMFFLL